MQITLSDVAEQKRGQYTGEAGMEDMGTENSTEYDELWVCDGRI